MLLILSYLNHPYNDGKGLSPLRPSVYISFNDFTEHLLLTNYKLNGQIYFLERTIRCSDGRLSTMCASFPIWYVYILVLLCPSPHHCLYLVQAPPPSKGYHGSKSSIFSIRKQKEEEMQINRVKVQKTLNRLMPYPKSTKIHNMEYEFHIDQIFLDVPFYLLSYSCLII